MKSLVLQKQIYKQLTLKKVIISLIASVPSLALWFIYLELSLLASWDASIGWKTPLQGGLLFIAFGFITYNLFNLLPMIIISKITQVNPIKVMLIMYAPFILLITYWLLIQYW